MTYIGVASIAGCYLAIIAMYVWVFKTVSEIRKEMNSHMNCADQHASAKDLVFSRECQQTVKRIEALIDSNKEQTASIKEYMSEEFKEIKQMIRDGHD